MSEARRDAETQPERTQLSWERTATGFLAIGALLALRHGELSVAGRSAVAALAFVLALATVPASRARPTTRFGSPRAVHVVGYGTAVLAVAVAVLVLSASAG